MATTERLTIPSSDAVQLEALLHLPEGRPPLPGMVVCHPHPLYGGDMNNPVVEALCRAGLDAGYAVLRFNFRGTGASSGRHDNGEAEADDVRAAVAELAADERVSAVDVVGGYSFGSMMALKAADVASALLLVSPPLGMNGLTSLPDAPTLVLSGDRDEYVEVAALQAAAASAQDATVVIAEGADHFWWGADQFLSEQAWAFLQARQKAAT